MDLGEEQNPSITALKDFRLSSVKPIYISQALYSRIGPESKHKQMKRISPEYPIFSISFTKHIQQFSFNIHNIYILGST